MSYTDLPETYFDIGSHIDARDAKVIRKSVSGMIKLPHPDGNVSTDEVLEDVELGMELRRRVKKQLTEICGLG